MLLAKSHFRTLFMEKVTKSSALVYQTGALLFACNVNNKSYNSAKIPHNRKVPIPFSLSLLYAKNILFYRKSGCAGACRQAVAAHSIKGKDRENMRDYQAYIGEICDTLLFPAEAKETMEQAWKKICANTAAKETFLKWPLVYEADGEMNYKEVLKSADAAAKEAGIAAYTADLLIYLLMTAHLKERYQEKGISEQIWLDSCMDLNWKLHECRKMYGIWGSFVSWWFDGFFEMTRFALGRLQFELMDFPESYEKTGHVRPEGMTKVINMHIPSCGPLKREDCEASFRQAAAFFADAFPGEEIAFFCESWLLYPRHREFLSPDSGIVQFMSFFDIYKTEEGDGDLWRIYNREYDGNPEALPEETTIQRGYRKLLLSGGHAGYGEGIFFRKKKGLC